jgi:hypothetical protein
MAAAASAKTDEKSLSRFLRAIVNCLSTVTSECQPTPEQRRSTSFDPPDRSLSILLLLLPQIRTRAPESCGHGWSTPKKKQNKHRMGHRLLLPSDFF